ncbi:beta-galactosidase [Streptomyces olivaceus]|uniref:beta-galactosidase n=1 Tax=Streptomyces olivaceus TaxID=47716 RepID=A0ABS7W8C6_STROV|nr:beta-galactosidase [Streptomyces olivaceus]MBZ6091220.1 beta-galactosidase [Streptomyces olivaceus]MBZ6097751.1 beta-galactosidase [Streptomyces olivaceus]MBZ6118300.1 beta-galactosidase [Streptomyces olivaceus]MBZ6153732.1 beta-galactosidase [Streptomyces olivaceus]MBZ6299803.1 beta-galactosidase [Streptomyces olivaceus]
MELNRLGRRAFSALAGTTVLGLALGGSVSSAALPGAAGPVPTGPPPGPPEADGARHRVALDRYSLLVDGRRLALWAGELHPFRLPSPSLWRDVLQKLRAYGHNAVSVRLAWNEHSPAPGAYDFTGVRDLGLFLRTAAECGLYVVLHPGPYIGADVDAGGLPGWLTATGGRGGATDREYLRHADEWLRRVDAIVARHQFTRGTGTVLLYRLDPAERAGLTRLHERIRADGIDVPLLHADTPLAWGEVAGARDAAEARREHFAHLAQGITLHNVRMAFGGTSWGWLPAPSAPTPAYDPTAAIDAARRPTPALAPLHQLGHLLRHVPDFARLEEADEVRAADARVAVRHLANPDTGAHAYVLRNDSAADVTSTLPMGGTDVEVTVPARDAKLFATGLHLGSGRKLAYANVQPMLSLSVGGLDITAFVGRAGEQARLVLDCPDDPWPTRLDEEAAWVFEDRRLHVTVPLAEDRLTRVRVRSADTDRTMLLLFADDAASLRLWPYETPSGRILVRGPELLRGAVLDGATVRLTGDTVGERELEAWVPRGITGISWNGEAVQSGFGRALSLMAVWPLPGVPELVLPALDGWRRRSENPESRPGYGDEGWTVADRRTSRSTTPVPKGQPVLFADDYGFHYGDVWYRGRLTGAAGLESVSLSYRTGAHGLLMAWLDGEPLGTHRVSGAAAEDGGGTWTGTARFRLPGALRAALRARRTGDGDAPAVLSVLVRRTQHAQDAHRSARGLAAARFEGAAPDVAWRIMGAAAPDPVRGPLNNGGLYGERYGWHLPGHDDAGWEAVSPAAAAREEPRQGVTWYRTTFRLDVPPEVDAPVGLVLDGSPDRDRRVQVFLNGWNLGEYTGGGTGAPPAFVLPNGILRTRAAANTLALAVLSGGDTPPGPGPVRLELLGGAAGGVPVEPVPSPGSPGSPGTRRG